MPSYSLIECKLRRYFYLGHKYSIYVPTSTRSSFWERQPCHRDDVTCIGIIGKIVKKNKAEEINSIVPIIIKLKMENTLHDERLLIYTLAVCSQFNVKQCAKMVADAYAAVLSICTDGLKLLMFVKFCFDARIILHKEGYLSKVTSNFGRGFRKAMNKWYLSRDPLKTAEQIMIDKCYKNLNHKVIMKLVHIHSEIPSRKMYIIHTLYGMEKVEEIFGSAASNIKDDDYETIEDLQFKFVYNYLKQVNSLKNMDEKTLCREIELRRWGHEYKVLPKNVLKNPTISKLIIVHMPLRDLLDHTFFFAKHKLFADGTADQIGLRQFISNFNNIAKVKKNRIHPIESYLEYVKYSRTFLSILKLQNNILKKQENLKIELPEEKLKLVFELTGKKSPSIDDSDSQITNSCIPFEGGKCSIQSNIDEGSTLILANLSNLKINFTQQNKNSEHLNSMAISTNNEASNLQFNSKLTKQKLTKSEKNDQTLIKKKTLAESVLIAEENKKKQDKSANTCKQSTTTSVNIQQESSESKLGTEDQVKSKISEVNQSQSNFLVFMKPAPKLVDKLLKFLSEDLLKITSKTLKPTDKRIMIAYDNRLCMKNYMCGSSRLLSVQEAITLITQTLIVPEKLLNKPTICGFNKTLHIDRIEVEFENSLIFSELESILFKKPLTRSKSNNKKDSYGINPLTVMNLAKKTNKIYDVFVFLGTNEMNFRRVKSTIKAYQTFSKKPVKIIVCCLNGKHLDQRNLSRDKMLFITGFDKNVGKIIHSFINEEF